MNACLALITSQRALEFAIGLDLCFIIAVASYLAVSTLRRSLER